MEKRRKKRFARRVQVRYWPVGDEHARKGYTTNVSTTGAFIATNAPLAPGSRLRIEFLAENSFFVEAIVTHAARIATALQSIRSSGMGIRFLSISELISELLPTSGEHDTEQIDEIARRRAVESVEDRGTFERPLKKASRPTYTVGFRNVAYLLDSIDNELAFGGIFVATDSPSGIQEEVRIALALPAPIKRTVHAEATVVQVADVSSGKSESTINGMGVALKDPAKVLAELNKLIESARPPKRDEG